uniref:Ribosomal protein S4 n=1 Tax=Physarum polycephalum TaxID=5791 RepID=F2Y9V3_PHYPO|nr:ribosomal protein S4 [Physarum polycephalum]
MITYIQNTNKNSFTLRFKKYKRLRRDVWGRLALRNKKNYVTAVIRTYAQRELMKRIRNLTRRRKRRIRRKFKIRRKVAQFQYAIQEKPKVRLGKPYEFRVDFRFLAKSLRFFYNLRKTKSSLRKLFTPIHKPIFRKKIPFFLEHRADVLFFRANFVDNINQARLFLKTKQLSYLVPKHRKKNSFVTQKIILKPYTQIPIFTFFKLSPLLAFKRKKTLYHALRSRNKLIANAPKWLYVNYKLMIALFIRNARDIKYYFPYSKKITSFLGAAKYF